jgi:dTDP-glucose 4,6-dehydratase
MYQPIRKRQENVTVSSGCRCMWTGQAREPEQQREYAYAARHEETRKFAGDSFGDAGGSGSGTSRAYHQSVEKADITTDRVIVTGGYGFIGSAFIRRLAASGRTVVNLDVASYAGDKRRLEEVAGSVHSFELDVAGDAEVRQLFAEVQPDLVVHFAAESHVTRSELEGGRFYRTNVEGTRVVIKAAIDSGASRVVHISTDEVYGPCLRDAPFRESDKEPGEGKATSPYARSKAVADDIATTMAEKADVAVVRLSNCYGPWQHPEKAIARWIGRALSDQPLPVWGDGSQRREWLYVDDAVAAIDLIAADGTRGGVYNVSPEISADNASVARAIAKLAGRDPESDVYLTAYDRPQHDVRYAIDASRIKSLGWSPRLSLEEGIERTVQWYRENEAWWESHRATAEAIYSDDAPQEPRET